MRKKDPRKTYHPHDPYLGKHKDEVTPFVTILIVVLTLVYFVFKLRGG